MPMFINRLIVLGASLVCSVDSTRCPVSAALTAISAVSKSRISPTRMMLGSCRRNDRRAAAKFRSEEHTSELQSLRHLVCRLLLEKKKKEKYKKKTRVVTRNV